jgi:hypothetical protein
MQDMDTAAMRQKRHNYLEVAEDKKVKAIYTMMQESIKESAVDYSKEFKAELDARYEMYKDGSAKMISAKESKSRLQKIIKARRK